MFSIKSQKLISYCVAVMVFVIIALGYFLLNDRNEFWTELSKRSEHGNKVLLLNLVDYSWDKICVVPNDALDHSDLNQRLTEFIPASMGHFKEYIINQNKYNFVTFAFLKEGKVVAVEKDGIDVAFKGDYPPGENCFSYNAFFEYEGPFAFLRSSPSQIVFDLDGNGLDLTHFESDGAVYWNIDLDEMAESSGWVGANDGQLVMDYNKNKIIDDQSELFGTATDSGFGLMKRFDSNSDNQLDNKDEGFKRLKIWKDINNDGFSQPLELYALSALDIVSIDLNYKRTDYSLAGNSVRWESAYTKSDGTINKIAEVTFAYDNMNTFYNKKIPIDLITFYLPRMRGYGNLPNLTQAMSMNEKLRDRILEIWLADMTEIITPSFSFQEKAENILYMWAKVNDIDPASRGPNIDARKLLYLVEITDKPYLQRGHPNPKPQGAKHLKGAFNTAYDQFLATFLIQASGEELFYKMGRYNQYTDEFEGDFKVNWHATEKVVKRAGIPPEDLVQAWDIIIRLFNVVIGLENFSPQDHTTLEKIVRHSDPSGKLTLKKVMDHIKENSGAPYP